MEVFIPHLKDRNIYLEEMICFSSNEFVYGNYKEYLPNYKIVNIQFPEAIFDWVAPSVEQLFELEKNLINWKIHSKIVYTMNDFSKHYDESNNYLSLFKLIHKYADGVIHLGKYSLNSYCNSFATNCIHSVIYHPLYTSLVDEKITKDISQIVNVNLQKKFVVSAIGGIRSKEEMKLILNIFRKLPIKNKVLIVPRMFMFLQTPKIVPYRFRKLYRKILETWYAYPLNSKQYYFEGNFIEYPYMVDLVKKSSLMIIPRVKNLNSGSVFLGLTFDIPMIIPKIGNLSEIVELFKLPFLDLDTMKFDFRDLVSNSKQIYNSEEYQKNKQLFHPKKIAQEYDAFFDLLLSKQ